MVKHLSETIEEWVQVMTEPGMFDPEGKRGKTIDKRREEHKARRGVKGAKVPAYKVEEVVAKVQN